MAVTTPIVGGVDNYINIYSEATWGTRPGSPTVLNLPVTGYTVASQRNSRQTQAHYGQFGAIWTHHVNGMPSGKIAGELLTEGKKLEEKKVDVWEMLAPAP